MLSLFFLCKQFFSLAPVTMPTRPSQIINLKRFLTTNTFFFRLHRFKILNCFSFFGRMRFFFNPECVIHTTFVLISTPFFFFVCWCIAIDTYTLTNLRIALFFRSNCKIKKTHPSFFMPKRVNPNAVVWRSHDSALHLIVFVLFSDCRSCFFAVMCARSTGFWVSDANDWAVMEEVCVDKIAFPVSRNGVCVRLPRVFSCFTLVLSCLPLSCLDVVLSNLALSCLGLPLSIGKCINHWRSLICRNY